MSDPNLVNLTIPKAIAFRCRRFFQRFRLLALVCLLGVLSTLSTAPGAQDARSNLAFLEIEPARSGIGWKHENAMSPAHYLPETMGAGVAFLDYDQDGWMDLYFVNSGQADFYQSPELLSDALYRNNRDGSFSEVTRKAGIQPGNFGMGVAAADYDNDGYPDLLVTAYGGARLYRNQGNGTFQNVTTSSGVDVPGWSTGAVFFDYNNDRLLDLFVARYVKFGRDLHISCGLNPLGKSYYCVPRVFDPMPALLFRNSDGLHFTAADSGEIAQTPGKSLGVVATDINNDRLMDLFVANDTLGDFLWVNRGEDGWEEMGIFAMVAYSVDGRAQSGMGVASADFDQDGWEDLFVSNIDHQNYSLFLNNRDESFKDVTLEQALAEPTFLLSGWGVKFLDVENDGDLDLFLANGHPDDMISEYSSNVTYREPLLLFENREGALVNVSGEAGSIFQKVFSSRGLAAGDYDNDGLIDLVVSNNGEGPLLLRNTSGQGNHWVGLRLESTSANRDAVGARLRWSVNGEVTSRLKTAGGSYLSYHDPRLVLGLGKSNRVDWVEVEWPRPSQVVERFHRIPVNRYIHLREGTGEAVSEMKAQQGL